MSSSKPLYAFIWASAFLHYREFQFALITLMVYDHAITLGKERRLISVSLLLASEQQEYRTTVITLRVWYLFSRNAFVRTIAVGALCSSIATSLTLVFTLLGTIESFFTASSPTRMPSAGRLVWLYVPALILHSILFALKVYRFVQGGKFLHVEGPSRRFLKEGMLMYVFVTGSIVFSIICVSFTAPTQISVFILALASFPTTASVVAVCRVMLSIRSLQVTFHVDPAWVLNNAEMSRLPLRGGPTQSVLCVECNGDEQQTAELP
ncbi:hypothetical protein EDD16DRAFT_1517331 [Pisolithus croceorrhizus]|nr:hypothetical protein EDD16DRAFT_1517331 [Pisolithus croceorrhizus]KAI6168196.1 hypothetical protein EDD17DRAFT_1503805 [Pisolithus thermaeus]